jgi:Holliday junction resolvase RusA-like endonuclease
MKAVIHGTPQPAGSKRGFYRGGRVVIVDANPKSRDWKDHVKAEVQRTYTGPLLTGPVKLDLRFCGSRPKSHYGTGKNKDSVKTTAPDYPTVKPDALKLARAVEDALTGVVYKDDAQVVEMTIRKVYSTPPRVELAVTPL